jgi:sugar/nucleoside kinase (ribokinase family)
MHARLLKLNINTVKRMPKKSTTLGHAGKDFDCTVLGDVFTDVILGVNGDYRHFFRGGTSYCDFAKVVSGGSGNIAVGLSSLSVKSAFVGKAGDDFFGKLYKQDLKNEGVVPKIFFDKDFPTGLLIAFVENGKERSFLVFRGANDHLSIGEIEEVASLIKRSKYVYFSGYSLVNDPQRSAILRAIEIARKFKAKIVFDPGACNLVNSKQKLFAELLDICDIFSPNQDEAKAITNTTNIEDAITKLRNRVPLVALRCGGNGCILISKKNIVKVPSFKVKCLDPTGAGDAFAAALIYGLTAELSLESIGRLANWFAAKLVTQIGSRSYPSKSEINSYLQKLTK